MAEIFLPDSRFEIPSLFYPGRKPVGNVKIDWSNPLTKGLVQCYLFTSGGYKNLVDGVEATQETGLSITGDRRLQTTQGSNNGLSFAESPIDDQVTIACNFNTSATDGNYGTLLSSHTQSSGGTPAGIALLIEAGANYLFIHSAYSGSNGGIDKLSENITLGTEYSALATRSGTSCTLDVNGVPASGTSFDYWRPSVGFNRESYGGGSAATLFKYGMVWNRALTAVERDSFNNNPYQFIIPV